MRYDLFLHFYDCIRFAQSMIEPSVTLKNIPPCTRYSQEPWHFQYTFVFWTIWKFSIIIFRFSEISDSHSLQKPQIGQENFNCLFILQINFEEINWANVNLIHDYFHSQTNISNNQFSFYDTLLRRYRHYSYKE